MIYIRAELRPIWEEIQGAAKERGKSYGEFICLMWEKLKAGKVKI